MPLTAALLSLPLSAAAIFLSLQQPKLILIVPDQIRVAQGVSPVLRTCTGEFSLTITARASRSLTNPVLSGF